MRRTKKQHFVPQSALRRFSQDGETLFVFDKIRNEVRIANIRDIAQQRYFYDIPEEAVPIELEDKFDRQIIERRLGVLESDFNSIVNRVICNAVERGWTRRLLNLVLLRRGRIISRSDKQELCFFVTLQYLRTREFRLTIQDGLEQFEVAIRKMIPADQINKLLAGFRGSTDANIRMHHLSMMFDDEFVNWLTNIMYHHILVIGKNDTGHKLYTSDNPLVRQPHKVHPFLGNAGIGSPGIELAMPLSSEITLIFMERTHFASWAKWDRKLVSLKPGHVEYYNSLQVKGCDRQVYCASEDFDVAREFCRRWPERCAEERRRVTVE